MSKTTFIGALLFALAGGTACQEASALATKPLGPLGQVRSGHFIEGLELGERNGTLIVQRLRRRTIETQGCGSLGDLERALLAVTRTVHPSETSNDQLVAGFYSGYIRAVKLGIRTARADCESLAFLSGTYPGNLLGAALCSAGAANGEALTSLDFGSFYSGWTGGETNLQTECETSLLEETTACGVEATHQVAALCADQE